MARSAFTDGFIDPFIPQRCTTGPVEPLHGTNKDACGAKLLLTTVLAYPVDCVCFCYLICIKDTALLPMS